MQILGDVRRRIIIRIVFIEIADIEFKCKK